MLSNAEPRVKSDASETAAACQDDDLVTRLMIYQSRNLAAQRRRRILTSVGLAAAVLAASVAAWQSWGTYWSFG